MDFGFLRGEFGEDAAEPEGVFAEGGVDEVVCGGGGVALVEDEADDFEDGGVAGGELGAARHFEGDVFSARVRLARLDSSIRGQVSLGPWPASRWPSALSNFSAPHPQGRARRECPKRPSSDIW